MNRSHSTTSRSAFTLIEVLVALLVFSMVLTLLYGTWRILMQSNAAGLRIAANAQRSRMTIQTIEEALNSAVFFNSNARHYSFLAEEDGGFSALSFVAHLSSAFPGSGHFDGQKVRRVTFTVAPDAGGSSSVLLLQQNSILSSLEDGAEPFPIPLANDISAFEVTFWDTRRSEFTSDWKQTNTLPALVRVVVGFGHQSRFNQQPAETIIRFIRIPSAGVAGEAQVGFPASTTLPQR